MIHVERDERDGVYVAVKGPFEKVLTEMIAVGVCLRTEGRTQFEIELLITGMILGAQVPVESIAEIVNHMEDKPNFRESLNNLYASLGREEA